MKKSTAVILLFAVLIVLGLSRAEQTEPEVFTSGDYQYVLLEDGTAEIVGYSGETEELVIPDALNGFKVTGIGDYAFYKYKPLTSVTIPDGVARIGDDAFSLCRYLSSVTIPDSVSDIGRNPFVCCYHLNDFVVSANNPYLSVIDGVLFSEPDQRLVCFPSALEMASYTIPDGILVIGDEAFYGNEFLTSITIPDSVVFIGEGAFQYCELASLAIPDSVTEIGEDAFSDCDSLTVLVGKDS